MSLSDAAATALEYFPITVETEKNVNAGEGYAESIILMFTSLFQFESSIWSSNISLRDASEATCALGETSLRTDHNVSRISPSTTPAFGMKCGECLGKH